MSDHDPTLKTLPDTLPIFPLTGVLLLPHGQLPLNIFEPRYLAMTRDAMSGPRLIGMVQPIKPGDEGGALPAIYDAGCAGRISAFEETGDGRGFAKPLLSASRDRCFGGQKDRGRWAP